jgi:polar amino acid transport system substrate-binding protein
MGRTRRQEQCNLYAKKGSGIKINSLETKKIAAIATTTNWFTEQYLKEKGFANLVSSSSHHQC